MSSVDDWRGSPTHGEGRSGASCVPRDAVRGSPNFAYFLLNFFAAQV
jgi:hypothetical protein